MDQDILEQLYRQYYGPALLYALSLCRDETLAEDLVADAFVKALVSLDNSHPAFQFWMFRVLKHQWADLVRRNKRTLPVPPAEQLSPEQLLLQDERKRLLWSCIQKLPQTDREVLTLHYFSGLSMAEIGQMFGKSPGAVKTKLCRLRQQLRQEMEAQGYEV